MKKDRWNLYWCRTPDHCEDWFVVARTAREAARTFEAAHGYDPGDAEARRILPVPPHISLSAPGRPDDALLAALGAVFRRRRTPRVVEIAGRLYEEGRLRYQLMKIDDDFSEDRGRGRPHGTPRPEFN
ncbi:MAG TPA: hypothetical protein VNO22_16760 [Planctomycetota bacterium]|nr:hypothetical protein [Planctomycetota bacterium]